MLLSIFSPYSISFMVINSAALYLFLKDDYLLWKKHQSFDGMKSEELVELMRQLKENRLMLFFELIIGFAIWFGFMVLTIDVLHIKWPTFLIVILIPIYFIGLQIYVIKKRMRKSIDIFKNAKRTA